ncbi:MAG: polysaccharide biosynthesis PFTS motif protein [Candidatus Omnitrophica bacterium]|nr:polysaccharide biosynthesis PFTS motif protein [Candidatus Omnitrophota bacterium]
MVNLPLYYVLSFFDTVEAYEVDPPLNRCKRIRILNFLDYIDWDEGIITRSEAVKTAGEIVRRIPDEVWDTPVCRRKIGFADRAKQDLYKEIEKFLYLAKIVRRCKAPRAYVVHSLVFRYLRRHACGHAGHPFFDVTTHRVLSAINAFLDRVYFISVNAFFLLRLWAEYIRGLCAPADNGHEIRYIYDGDNPLEVSTDKGKLTFTWIVDGRHIKKENILFLLPGMRYKKPGAGGAGFHTAGLADLYRLADRRRLVAHLPALLASWGRVIVSSLSCKNILRTGYMLRSMRWAPCVDTLRPKVYLYTLGNAGIENPAIAYFKAMGMKTISWSYSSSVGRFLTGRKPEGFDFRDRRVCYLMTDLALGWNNNFRDFLLEHPQGRVRVETLGPLMSGDEDAAGLTKKELCRREGIPYRDEWKYLAVFDTPVLFPGIYSAVNFPIYTEYKHSFMKDIRRLLDDYPDCVIVLKPKRSLKRQEGFYTDEIARIIDEMRESGRAIILDYKINPWVPIGLADVCISQPFGSPNMAALHYGKPVIFHDPWNIARYPRYKYDRLLPLISRDYEDLKAKVAAYLGDPRRFKQLCDTIDITDYVGIAPGTNSTRKFREVLKKTAEENDKRENGICHAAN